MLCKPLQKQRKFWVRTDLKKHLASTALLWSGTLSTIPGCFKTHPALTWTFPGIGQPHLSLENRFQCLSTVKFCADLFLPDQEAADNAKGMHLQGTSSNLGSHAGNDRQSHTWVVQLCDRHNRGEPHWGALGLCPFTPAEDPVHYSQLGLMEG